MLPQAQFLSLTKDAETKDATIAQLSGDLEREKRRTHVVRQHALGPLGASGCAH
jgi:hypothetical protein